MSLDADSRTRIQALVEGSDVLLFMKGDREAPQCGFSATVVGLLDRLIPRYATVDVLADPAIREGVKTFSDWPTIPQLYVKGEFIGGCDIIEESFASGELLEKLGIAIPSIASVDLSITPAAAEQLRQATQSAPEGHALHLAVDARYRSRLTLQPAEPGEVAVESEGVSLYLDPMSASRAEGAVIDLARTKGGVAFQVRLPRAPNVVRPMSVLELKAAMDRGERLALYDVRTPEERATAQIEGSVLVDADEARRIESLPTDAFLVFHCHHGQRSQAAAEHFASLGFTNLHNLEGGIDAWSQQIDPSLPRY
jgi:monothiol glutaredoxin